MARPDAHHVTRLLYQSVVDPSKWSQTLAAIADSFSAGHVLVGMRTEGEEPEYLSARVDDVHLRQFWKILDESPLSDFPSLMPTGTFVASASVMDLRAYVSLDFYQAVIRPMGGHHGLLGLPFRYRNERSFIAVCRSERQGDFASGTLSRLQVLMPHMQTALSLQRRLAQRDSALWHREYILDSLDVGVVLLDKRQRPLVVNRRARELFALRKEVVLGPDGLHSSESSLTRTLQKAIGEATHPGALAGAALRLRIERPGSTPLLLRVVPVAAAGEYLDAWPRAAVAVFVDTLEQASLRPELLRAWFGFSAREAELAVLLASGTDLNSSARAMGIGLETARTHLDRLFTKTGTRRQAELVSVLLRAAWRL